MESQNTRVLIVANRTASTPRLLEAVRRRAEASPCEFALLIPDVTDRKTADWTLETAQRLLRPATGARVDGLVGGPDPFASVQDVVRQGNFDEIIISTLPTRVSKWLRRDLPRRVEALGGARHGRHARARASTRQRVQPGRTRGARRLERPAPRRSAPPGARGRMRTAATAAARRSTAF
jgi:hypothetical protein